MKFWGVKVRAGEPVKVPAEEGVVVHVSQATLDPKTNGKGSGSVMLTALAWIDGKREKFFFGKLSGKKSSISLDLSFEKEFELSHDGQGVVHLVGHKTTNYDNYDDELVPAALTIPDAIAAAYGNAPAAVANVVDSDDDTEERSAKKEKKLKRCDRIRTTMPKARDIGRIIVRGFEPGLVYGEDVERSLTRLFGSCGKITDVYVDASMHKAFVYFLGEGAVDKALQVNGTDMGTKTAPWKISVEPYPFRDEQPTGIWVKGYSRKLHEDEIKTAITDLFSSCGEITKVELRKDYTSLLKGIVSNETYAWVSIRGIEAAEKALELNGSYIGTKQVSVLLACQPPRVTRHKRRHNRLRRRPTCRPKPNQPKSQN